MIVGSAPARANAEVTRAEVAGAVVGEHDPRRSVHAIPFVERIPPSPGGDRLPQRLAERLERRLGDVVVVGAGRLDVNRAACLHREPLERVREKREGEAADPLAGEGERDLGVRPPDEVDRGRGPRLVHRDDGRAVARDPLARAERLLQGAPERGEDVLDRVVLVDVEIAARNAVEIEARRGRRAA